VNGGWWQGNDNPAAAGFLLPEFPARSGRTDAGLQMMRREKGSKRPPLTEAQRRAKPPVSQPIY